MGINNNNNNKIGEGALVHVDVDRDIEPCFVKEYCGNFKCECHTEFFSCRQQETSNSSTLNVLFDTLKHVCVSQGNI